MLRASAPPGSTGHPVISAASAAALSAAAAMRSQNGQLMTAGAQAAPPGASPYIAAAPMIRKMVTGPACTVAGTPGTHTIVGAPGQNSQQQKLYTEEMMLEAQAVSQAPSDVPRDEG